MRDIPEFKLDEISREFSPYSKIALHSSYPYALSLQDLIDFSNGKPSPVRLDAPLSYAPSLGTLAIRKRLAELYSTEETKLTEANVLITPGSILANYLVLTTAFKPGDHVICQFPTYGQLYALPKHLGVEVDLWAMREEASWIPSVQELKSLIKPNTKAIILNNPSNPTGTTLGRETLEQIRDLAQEHGLTLFADEVFRPLFHGTTPTPPSIIHLNYTKSVTTGSMSKAFSLSGIRIGWVISPDPEIIQQVTAARDYTTLNVSSVDDAIALFALDAEVLPKILKRNMEICATSIQIIEEFVNGNPTQCRWVKPTGAGTAFIRLSGRDGNPIDELALTRDLVRKTGVTIIPGGYCFGEEGVDEFRGYVRINLGQPEKKLVEGLGMLEEALREL